ncbi:polysaccharide pyruvyl transferase family protein [Actinopolyspora saharensis]|uniref:polysaccharide pyruvyl transferase family protein n=1 Tax=Actinopolyspora saharensis TaxID=995062 RepID=UPI003F675E62
MRALVVGWPSFLHGEATAGDVAAMRHVADRLRRSGIDCDTAWSPGFLPGQTGLEAAPAEHYTDLVFVCGPAHGDQVLELHRRYARCRRTAVGVSVIDGTDPAVTGFHRVLARDGPGRSPTTDLAARRGTDPVPVVGVVLAPQQPEYGDRREHSEVHRALRRWISQVDCAPLELDSRLATDEWRRCRTPEQFASLVGRTDLVLTTRLHGLVFGLSNDVPVLAVDPVTGGGKVSAQAWAWDWPALLGPAEARLPGGEPARALEHWWRWCTSPEARRLAHERAAERADSAEPLLTELVDRLRTVDQLAD